MPPLPKPIVKKAPVAAAKALNVHTRRTFVAPAVQETPLTTALIDHIMPYYPLSCTVIAGYLDADDQYWKVNYHWDILTTRLAKFQKLDDPSATAKARAQHLLKVMMSNPPLPERGYAKDKKVNTTKDSSPRPKIKERHKLMADVKKEFRLMLIEAGVVDATKEFGDPPPAEKPWWLAVAKVAEPGTSGHGTGYALDIAGNNPTIKAISRALGATMTFVESSHVHVEFANFLAPGSLYVPIPGLPGGPPVKW